MNTWGQAMYGDPCRECGYDWPADLRTAVKVVQDTPGAMRTALTGTDGTARASDLAWDGRSYVCHVTDNLRIWAERLVAARQMAGQKLGTYDADLLAEARNYAAIPLRGALWSLDEAVAAWTSAVDMASQQKMTLLHPERGSLTVADVAFTNAHDAYHHVFDVGRCMGQRPDFSSAATSERSA